MHIPFGSIDFARQALAIEPKAVAFHSFDAVIITLMRFATGDPFWPFGAGNFER
jgi:hypothetical protein